MNKDVVKQINSKNYMVAIKSAPIPMILHAEDGEVLLMSDSCLEATGFSFNEVNTIQKWTAAVHRDRKKYNDDFISDLFENGVVVQGEEEVVYTKSGEVLVWAFHNSNIGTLDDGRKAIVTICVDQTKKYQDEKIQDNLYSELEKSNILLQASLESHSEVIILSIDNDYNYYYLNSHHKNTMKNLYGCDVEVGENLLDAITIEEDRMLAKGYYDRALAGEEFVNVDLYGENHDRHFEVAYSPIRNTDNEIIGVSVIAQDITLRVKELERIKDSEEKFRLIYSSMSQGLAVHELITDENNEPIDSRYIEVNDSYTKLFGYKREDIIGKRVKEVAPNLETYWIKNFGRVAQTGEPAYYEDYSRSIGKYLSTYCYSPKEGQFAVLISDITDRIEREKEIEFLSYNDQLTKLYNRRYYEEQLIELDKEDYLPLSMIMGDVNGLKLVNDSFGHLMGDELLKKVAEILKKATRSTDIVTRIGGDEFVILLPQTSYNDALRVVNRVKEISANENVGNIEISISFGVGTKESIKESLEDLFKTIEDEMYKNKLYEGSSMRNKTVDLIMTTLYEKNDREMFHSQRVGAYSAKFAEVLGMNQEKIKQIRTAGLMHDIGKIGIPEVILNKTDILSKEEYNEVKKHSEIGYRILSSINEFKDIAKQVLEHHERWDGTGYPNGLKGKDIVLQARIIMIADAFDAMTRQRTYRDTLTKEEAIEELIRNKGKQFDPELVDIFIDRVIDSIEDDT